VKESWKNWFIRGGKKEASSQSLPVNRRRIAGSLQSPVSFDIVRRCGLQLVQRIVMLTEYIEAAMRKATYDKLEDGTYCGKIPECPGTIAFGETLYECQIELRSVLEGWLLVKIRHGDHLTVIDGLDLNKGIPTLEGTAAHG
jgi:predicted RNase H-like HicB family nuclease